MITYRDLGYNGRLGNQLFEIAGTLGLGLSRREKVSFPWWEYSIYFELPTSFYQGATGSDAAELPLHLDPRTRRFLQDLSLWENCKDFVKEKLSFSRYAVNQRPGFQLVWDLFDSGQDVISLHVRRGDNASRANGHLYYPLPTLEYYHQALDLYPKDLPVLVFSDEPDWCFDNFIKEFPSRDMTVVEGSSTRPETVVGYFNPTPADDWEDMYLMTKCKYHIIANSTYSWWGAWLANSGGIAYPSVWYGPEIAEYADSSLIMPSDWVKVPV